MGRVVAAAGIRWLFSYARMTHRIVLIMEPLSRREFQKRALAASLAAAFDGHGGFAQRSALDSAEPVPPPVTRTWLGPHFWANRLQDWRLHARPIERLAGAACAELRPVP